MSRCPEDHHRSGTRLLGAVAGATVDVGRAVAGAAVAVGWALADAATVGLPDWHFTSCTTAPLALTMRAKSVASLSLNMNLLDQTYEP